MKTIRSIETVYNGVTFRSRLEARWAVFFDHLSIPWEYEPEGYHLDNGEKYVPDFYLRRERLFLEIKPTTEEAWAVMPTLRRLFDLVNDGQMGTEPLIDVWAVGGKPIDREHVTFDAETTYIPRPEPRIGGLTQCPLCLRLLQLEGYSGATKQYVSCIWCDIIDRLAAGTQSTVLPGAAFYKGAIYYDGADDIDMRCPPYVQRAFEYATTRRFWNPRREKA